MHYEFLLLTLLAFVVISHIQKHYESCEMKREMTQWKCFVPDTPSFCDQIWSCVELFSETFHTRRRCPLLLCTHFI